MSTFEITEAILQRVRKLLERAGHEGTPEEEARTAGVIAARLIYRYRIPVGALPLSPPYAKSDPMEKEEKEEERPRPNRTWPDQWWPPPKSNDQQPEPGVAPGHGQASARPDGPKNKSNGPSPSTRWVKRNFYRIYSRYPGWCQCCFGEYREETYIAWVKGEGATHWECSDYWSNGFHTTRGGSPW